MLLVERLIPTMCFNNNCEKNLNPEIKREQVAKSLLSFLNNSYSRLFVELSPIKNVIWND